MTVQKISNTIYMAHTGWNLVQFRIEFLSQVRVWTTVDLLTDTGTLFTYAHFLGETQTSTRK